MTTNLKKLFRQAYNKARDDSFRFGLIGKHNPDTSVDFEVVGRADFLWVTLADKTVVQARNEAGVPQVEDLPVKLRVTHGTFVIVSRDNSNQLAVPTPTPPSGVLPHPLSEHSDVTITAAASGDVLAHNGTDWVDEAPLTTSAGAGSAGKLIRLDAGGHVDATMINDGDIDHTAITNIGTNTHAQIDTHIAATAAHGATGAVMGTTNAQTVQNKTLDSTNISSLTAKNPPVDADSVVIVDSAASNFFKRVTWANIKAALTTVFDALYAPIAKGVTGGDSHDHNGGDGAQIDHGGTGGLGDDDHSQYLLLAGRSGGQTVTGIASTGNALRVVRDLAAASTDDTVVEIVQENADDDQDALEVRQDGTGNVLTLRDGVTAVLVARDGGRLDIAQIIRALTASGLQLQDDDGVIFMTFEDGGQIGVGNTATSPTALLHLIQTLTSGEALRVVRNLASGSTDAPVVFIHQDHASDDQPALSVQQDGAALAVDVLGSHVSGTGLARFKGNGINGYMSLDSTGTGGESGFLVKANGVLMGQFGVTQSTGAVFIVNRVWSTTPSFHISPTNGYVGIFGASDPQAALHVHQTTLGSVVQRLQSTATNDDPLRDTIHARVATTDATTTTLFTYTIPASTMVLIEAVVTYRRTGGSAGTAEDGGATRVSATYKLVAGAATLIDSLFHYRLDDPNFLVSIDTSGATMRIRVAGVANLNVTWHADVDVRFLST